MNAVEWNKKEELVAEQALKHLKVQSQQGTVLAVDQLQLLTVCMTRVFSLQFTRG